MDGCPRRIFRRRIIICLIKWLGIPNMKCPFCVVQWQYKITDLSGTLYKKKQVWLHWLLTWILHMPFISPTDKCSWTGKIFHKSVVWNKFRISDQIWWAIGCKHSLHLFHWTHIPFDMYTGFHAPIPNDKRRARNRATCNNSYINPHICCGFLHIYCALSSMPTVDGVVSLSHWITDCTQSPSQIYTQNRKYK